MLNSILRQSTQRIVRVGPFLDVTDKYTPETGITLSAAHEAELLKAGGGATVDISAATWAAISGCDGHYNLTLTTTHTDTVGDLTVVVQDDSVCLPVCQRFTVLEEAVFDRLYAADSPLPDILYQGAIDWYTHPNVNVTVGGWGTNVWAGRPAILHDTSVPGTGIMSLSRCVSNVSGELTVDTAFLTGPTWSSTDTLYIMRDDAAAKAMMEAHYMDRIMAMMEAIPATTPTLFRFREPALDQAPSGVGYDPWIRTVAESYPVMGSPWTAGQMLWMLTAAQMQREIDGNDLYVLKVDQSPAMRFAITRDSNGNPTKITRVE